jgi:hypothetical protein
MEDFRLFQIDVVHISMSEITNIINGKEVNFYFQATNFANDICNIGQNILGKYAYCELY